MAAETIHQVASAVYDLPRVRLPRAATHGPRKVRVGPPGIRPFTQRIIVPTAAARTRTIALDTIAPGLNGMGYELKQQSPTELRFERSEKERIVIALEANGPGETLMIVHGRAPRSVRKTFARLSFS